MSGKIRLYGTTSGFGEITVPEEAGDQVFVVPSLGGELIVSGNNQSLSLGTGDLTAAGGTFSGNVKVGGTTGTPNISLNADGSATFAGNITAGNVSDVRFKTNIQPASPQLTDVVALGNQLKNWDWTTEAPLNDELKARRFLGLVAQEAEQVCPGLTYTVGEGDDSYKAINHDIIVMKLLGAVAELQAEVQALKGGN